MVTRKKHDPQCPQASDSDKRCLCDALEERLIRQASVPDAAKLIRAAKEQGLIKKSQAAYVPG